MAFQVTIEWANLSPSRPTIWQTLAVKLGREPTNAEASEEVKCILREAHDAHIIEQADQGRLPWQRKRY